MILLIKYVNDVLIITLNIDDTPTTSHTHVHLSHSQTFTFRLLSSESSLPLVCLSKDSPIKIDVT
jgi:hypothetical protein